MSLSAQIFLGLGLGIATGIFLGEITAPLKIVGEGFVQLHCWFSFKRFLHG